jgi:metallo-beta-lactamase class B
VALLVAFQGIPSGLMRPEYTAPQKPFTIAGSQGLGVYLITSPQGHILIDSGVEASARQALENIRSLGFKTQDVKILLDTHAHFDHVAGHSVIVQGTGAAVWAMQGDDDVLASGGATDFLWGGKVSFPAVKIAKVLKDGDTVSLGGNVLTAHKLGGHTKGNTVWTFSVMDDGVRRSVLVAPSMSVNPGTGLKKHPSYLWIADDYEKGFAWLAQQHPDIFVAPHTSFFEMDKKLALLATHPARNPFVDPNGLAAFVENWKTQYAQYLADEK